MLIELPDEGTASRDGFLGGGDAASFLAEAQGVAWDERIAERAPRRLDECESGEIVSAEVLGDRVGRASSAAGSAKGSLGAAEEALEHVRSGRGARVVEANEEVRSVALAESGDVLDEAAGRRAEPGARRLLA